MLVYQRVPVRHVKSMRTFVGSWKMTHGKSFFGRQFLEVQVHVRQRMEKQTSGQHSRGQWNETAHSKFKFKNTQYSHV